MPGIERNLLSVSALARNGLVVKFVDDKCIVHDLRDGDNVVAFGSVCRGLYRLDTYEKCANEAACTFFKAPEKYVCKGCIMGKMQRAYFLKDGSMRAKHKI